MLTLKIGERNIEIVESASFVRGTVGATCQITFEPFWEDYEKTVVFKRLGNGCITPFVIIANSQTEILTIPHEILAESGYFKIGVYGTKDNAVLPTLWSDNIKIEYGTDTYGEAPQPPTPNVYEQILKTSKNAVDTANSVRQDADNGKFNGEKGDKGDDYVLTFEDKQEIANMVDVETVTVDPTYSPTSENAQSGKAVAQATNIWQNHSLYNDIDGFVNDYVANNELVTRSEIALKEVQFNNGATLEMANWVKYVAKEPISQLTIDVFPWQYPCVCAVVFTIADTDDFELTFYDFSEENVSVQYIGGAPDFKAGETWELNIMDRVVVAGKVVDQ